MLSEQARKTLRALDPDLFDELDNMRQDGLRAMIELHSILMEKSRMLIHVASFLLGDLVAEENAKDAEAEATPEFRAMVLAQARGLAAEHEAGTMLEQAAVAYAESVREEEK